MMLKQYTKWLNKKENTGLRVSPLCVWEGGGGNNSNTFNVWIYV